MEKNLLFGLKGVYVVYYPPVCPVDLRPVVGDVEFPGDRGAMTSIYLLILCVFISTYSY